MFLDFLEFLPVKYYLCWTCTSNKNKALEIKKFSFSAILWNLLRSKFWNHFHAEIIPWSPIFLDFLTVLYMVWKNQESCESLLVGFELVDAQWKPKISINKFFFEFLRFHFEIPNYFETLNFLFSNIIPGGVLTH